ncbi:MAG: CpaD family pilus assembly protein [Hyphomicrobiales bacterium]
MSSKNVKSATRTVPIMAIGLAGALLAGCQSMPANNEDLAANPGVQYWQRYPIDVETGQVRMQVPTSHGANFTPTRESEIRKFVARYPSTAAGKMVISTPSGGGSKANAVSARVSQIASQENVPYRLIVHKRHKASKGSPVVISYQRHFAVTEKCGDWSRNMAVTGENRPYEDFGCSSQHNLAAMADNPRDLVTPRAMSPLYGTRNDVVYDKHIQGKKTSSQRDTDASGAVSEVAN